MKTPCEILFGRHENAGPRLDEIRREIVGRIDAPRKSISETLWCELIVPAQRAWMCFGAGWVVVLALNIIAGGDSSVSAAKSEPVKPDSVIALQRQEQLMARLAENEGSPPSPAEAPERRPRSEVRVEYKVV
ncbi:MAG TPA: hypothetical protein VGO67_21500 [Verrucomicrobiae bacterium]|jgi:hypothetical protein